MKIIRGDTSKFKFQRLDSDHNPILIPALQIYFTVKKNAGDKNFIFQKTMQDMELDAEGFYHVIIEPNDTKTCLKCWGAPLLGRSMKSLIGIHCHKEVLQ